MKRMKQAAYSEPAIGWNEEDFQAGVTTYGVSNYEGTAKFKITTPTRPALLPPTDLPETPVEMDEGHEALFDWTGLPLIM